jgi:hypothetical protein
VALTMTRIRTQTTLTKLVEMLANVHGELLFLEAQLAGRPTAEPSGPVQKSSGMEQHETRAMVGQETLAVASVPGVDCQALECRRAVALANRDALYATVRQFDPKLDPESIGTAEGWLKPFGRGTAGRKRYLRSLSPGESGGPFKEVRGRTDRN